MILLFFKGGGDGAADVATFTAHPFIPTIPTIPTLGRF